MARRPRKNVVIHLEGADELNNALRSMHDQAAGRLLKEASEAGAEVIRAEAANIAPRDTGLLSESLADRAISRQRVGRSQIDIGPTRMAWYGQLLEKGTSKMAARPFLRPAFDSKRAEAVAAVRAILRRLIKW